MTPGYLKFGYQSGWVQVAALFLVCFMITVSALFMESKDLSFFPTFLIRQHFYQIKTPLFWFHSILITSKHLTLHAVIFRAKALTYILLSGVEPIHSIAFHSWPSQIHAFIACKVLHCLPACLKHSCINSELQSLIK